MTDQFSKTLDQLMGRNRNATSSTTIKNEHFTNHDVCKYSLVSFCPHELFLNTNNYSMRPCNLRHDDFFKKQFQLLNDDERNPYERKYIDETIDVFKRQISLVDQKIQRDLAKNDNPANKIERIPSDVQEK